MEPVTFPIAENSDFIWFCVVMIASATLVEVVLIAMLVRGHVKGRILQPAEKITYGILTVILTIVFYLGAIEVYLEAHGSVTVTENSIDISNGLLYSREYPFTDLNVAETRIVDIHRMGDLYPGHRTNGTALGDLWSGNFRTRNGTNAYLLVSDPQNSVMLEHKDGIVIYLSPNDPQVFLNLVRERAGQ